MMVIWLYADFNGLLTTLLGSYVVIIVHRGDNKQHSIILIETIAYNKILEKRKKFPRNKTLQVKP